MNRRLYKIDDGENHYYSAESKEEAIVMHFEFNGYDSLEAMRKDYDDDYEPIVTVLSNDTKLTVRDDDTNIRTTKTAIEWADEDGFVASSIF